jgi:parvulin-like peptidyl-prolyl isomerase
MIIGKLKGRDLTPRLAKAEVTPAELQAAYTAGRDRFTRPAAVRLAVLYLKTDPVMRPERIAELQRRMSEARQKALAPEPSGTPGFGALAITCSEDQATRYNGGIVGWVEQNRGHAWLGAAAVEAGFGLKNPGEVSEVITDPKGVYLVKLLDRREAAVIPQAQVEASLRQRLLVEKRREIEQAFLRESRQSVPVEAHPELLARIPLPRSSAVAENKRPPSFP